MLPMLSLATAYIILRPFFRLRSELAGAKDIPLEADAWELNLDGTDFPGSTPGMTQAVLSREHPHLRLDETVVSIPRVEPGDQVYCEWMCAGLLCAIVAHEFWIGHTDIVHAVEAEHNGAGDSSVLYIPAVPLTERKFVRYFQIFKLSADCLPSAVYLRDQRENFLKGYPSPCVHTFSKCSISIHHCIPVTSRGVQARACSKVGRNWKISPPLKADVHSALSRSSAQRMPLRVNVVRLLSRTRF